MSNSLLQSIEAERLHAKWWDDLRRLATEIGAKAIYLAPDMVDVDLPDGWTQEAFFAEVDRRAQKCAERNCERQAVYIDGCGDYCRYHYDEISYTGGT